MMQDLIIIDHNYSFSFKTTVLFVRFGSRIPARFIHEIVRLDEMLT